MTTSSSKLVRPIRHCGLVALSVWILAGSSAALADATNSTAAQTRPESPSQVKPASTPAQNTSTFTPGQAKPAPTATNTNNGK